MNMICPTSLTRPTRPTETTTTEMTMQTELTKRRCRPAGFTLIELLVVITIIAILGAVAVPKLMRNPEKARIAAAKMDVKSLQLQANTFQLDHGKPPSNLAELKDYFEEGSFPEKDPWGGEYVMEQTKDGTVRIKCPNLDTKEGPTRVDTSIGGGGN
jgi:general secretion pathway protein G